MIKNRPSLYWMAGLLILSLAIAWYCYDLLDRAQNMTRVVVATKEIPADTLISKEDLMFKEVSADLIPKDEMGKSSALTDPKLAIGKFSNSKLYPGFPVPTKAVSEAKTMRENVRKYGLDHDGITIQLDPADLSSEHVFAGDTVDVIGVFNQQNVVTSKRILSNVPVLAVDKEKRKLLVAAPRSQAEVMARDMALGKVRVFLNPNALENEK